MNSSATSASVALGLVGEVEGLAVGEHAVAHLEDLRVGVARRRPPRRPRRTCRPTRPPRAGARAASAPPAAGCARASPARTPRAAAAARMRCSRSRSIAEKRPERKSITPSMRARYSSLRDVADARRLAALDVVVQARAAAAPARLGAGAGAEHEHLRQHLQRRAHALGVRVGPEVRAAGAVALAREVHARELLVERDRDERVGLVVAQADVEARPVLLDEALLGQQRLGLAGDHDALDAARRSATISACPGLLRADLRLGEVRGDALAHRLAPCRRRSRARARRGTGTRRAGRAARGAARRGSLARAASPCRWLLSRTSRIQRA